jgi:putative transposase
MGKVKFTAEQIIRKLREADVLNSQGATISIICKQLEIHEQTYYKWRKEYGGIRVDQVKRLKGIERENARLKKIVADLSIDNSILKEASRLN